MRRGLQLLALIVTAYVAVLALLFAPGALLFRLHLRRLEAMAAHPTGDTTCAS